MSRKKRQKLPFTIYLTEQESEIVRGSSSATGHHISTFLIEGALAYAGKRKKSLAIIPAINQEQWGKLAPLSSNLNQIAYKLNSNQAAELQAVHEARDFLRQVRDQLINPGSQ